jgi:prephenate dehydrogenase
MRIAFLGFGLIGGSVARALRAAEAPWRDAELVAWSPSNEGPAAAVAEGVLGATAVSVGDAVDGADLVVIGAPPIAALDLVDALAGPAQSRLPAGAVVTDVVSTKTAICARARAAGLQFVGGHPMAGRETAGYGASDAALFVDRPWVVVGDGAGDDAAARVEALARACRARPIRMTAADHDAAAAAISHVPLVTAAALVEAIAGGPGGPAPGWHHAAPLAASGWRDMTRLARGDVAMGAGILATNAAPVAEHLRTLRAALDAWLDLLEAPGGPDPDALARRFAAARERLADGEARPGDG